MMPGTVVVNCKTDQYDVLIDRTTIFGNPFKVWQWGREGCIAKFREYFYDRIERDPEWKVKVLAIREKGKDGVVRIGCHCAPLPCHGDVYKDYLDSYEWLEKIKKEAESK